MKYVYKYLKEYYIKEDNILNKMYFLSYETNNKNNFNQTKHLIYFALSTSTQCSLVIIRKSELRFIVFRFNLRWNITVRDFLQRVAFTKQIQLD